MKLAAEFVFGMAAIGVLVAAAVSKSSHMALLAFGVSVCGLVIFTDFEEED